MAKAFDVAKLLIELAQAEDEPDQLSHLRLQKLLYYAQGWSLALRNKALFLERIEAWEHGPVVPTVYRSFAKYGANSIPASDFVPGDCGLTEDECDLVHRVWESYKHFSATKLREMTHKEMPWREVAPLDWTGSACS